MEAWLLEFSTRMEVRESDTRNVSCLADWSTSLGGAAAVSSAVHP